MAVFERLISGDSSSDGMGVFSRIQQEQERQRQERLRQFNQAVPFDYRQTPLFQDVQQFTQQRQQQAQEQTRQALSALPTRSSDLTDRLRAQIPEVEPREPLLARAQRGLYDRLIRPVENMAGRFAANVADATMLGQFLNREAPSYAPQFVRDSMSPAETGAERAADIAGQIAGYIAPTAAAYRTGGRLATSALSRLSPSAGRVTQSAVRGLGSGLTLGTAREALDAAIGTEDRTLGERAGSVALETALFAGGDAAVTAIGPLVRRGLRTLLDRLPRNRQQEILALPEPAPRRLIEGPQQGEGVIPVGPNRVSEQLSNRPLGLPEPRFQPTRARTAPNPYRIKFENLIRRANELERQGRFTPGREYEELQELWSRMAERTDPGLDELIDLAYPSRRISPTALQRGRMAQAAGLGPNVRRYDQMIGEAAAPRERIGLFNRLREQTGAPDTPPTGQQTIRQAENIAEQPSFQRRDQTPLQQAESAPPRTEPQPTPTQAVQETIEPVPQRLRDRIVQRFDELEQQARERIAAQRNRISSNPLDIYRDYAIIGASKMVKGTVKFADWSEEMIREFGEEIRPRLRQIYEQSREFYQRTTKEAQEAIRFAESGTGDANTFRQKIARGKEARTRTSFMQKIDKLRTQLVDSAAPLERLERNIRGKLSSADESLYKTARLFKGVPAKAHEIVRTRLSPIIEQVERAGFSPEDLGDYALAMHSRDVNNQGIMSGFTNKEIDEVIQRFGTPEMEQARQALVQLGNDMLEELLDAQVISRELYDTLRARYPNYIPLFRHFDDDKVEFAQGLSDAMANVSIPFERLRGSQRKVVDPLENMVRNIFHSINTAERNRVALQLARLADEDVENQFIRRLAPDEKVGRKNVVTVRLEGEPVRFEVQPEVYKAILGLDEEAAGVVIDLLSKPASLLRAGATLTPEFSLRNPIRDIVQAYVTSGSGFNPFTDFPVALIETITKGRGIRIGNRTIGGNDLYTQFLMDNAGYGNLISMDRKAHREALERVMKQSPGRRFVNIVSGRSLLNVLRAIADTTETAVKLGEYRAALRSGATRAEAAYRARDVMDFARAGTKIRNINRAVAFMNANIQGKSKIIRAIKENPIGVTARGIKLITLPTIGVFLAQKYLGNETQQQIIRDAPNWMRNSFWLLPIPGTDQVARIPKPFDIAPIFANGPERLMEYIFDNDPEAFDNFVRDSIGSLSVPVMLTGLLPFIEGMANYSFFRQGPIIPQREQGIEFRDQYDLDTPVAAIALARVAETITGGEGTFANFSSPRITENLIRGLTAGLGDYANSFIDFIVKDLAGGEIEKPSRDISQQPLAKAFLVNQGSSGRSMDNLYSLRDRLNRERGSARLRGEEFDKEAQYRFVNTLTTEIGNITKMIREIENHPQLTAEQKGQAIRRLNQRRNDIARRGMDRYREVFEGR